MRLQREHKELQAETVKHVAAGVGLETEIQQWRQKNRELRGRQPFLVAV